MKKAFIGKTFDNEYVAFTRWKMSGKIAKVHSESHKYDVTKPVKQSIANWIGERILIMKDKNLTSEEFGELIGSDFNKLQEELNDALQKGDEQ